MQNKVNGIRQPTETSQFANHGYNSGNNLFPCLAGASCQVWPWDTTTQQSECIRTLEPGRNSIYEDASWIRQAGYGTQAEKSAEWLAPVSPSVAATVSPTVEARTHTWNKEIRRWRNSSGAVRGAEKRYDLLFLYGQYRVCIQNGPTQRDCKNSCFALKSADNWEKKRDKRVPRTSFDLRPLKKSLMTFAKSIHHEDL